MNGPHVVALECRIEREPGFDRSQADSPDRDESGFYAGRPEPNSGRIDPISTNRLSDTPLKSRGFGQVDPEPVAVAPVAARHLGGGVAELSLHGGLVGPRRGGKPAAQRCWSGCATTGLVPEGAVLS